MMRSKFDSRSVVEQQKDDLGCIKRLVLFARVYNVYRYRLPNVKFDDVTFIKAHKTPVEYSK